MRLISAHIQNFRLLKNLKLNFSTDEKKPLTVIRAANETGKTTCLTALTWCLYGSSVLPNKGDYVLFPSDEVRSGRLDIEISVEIEFELEHSVKIGREPISVVRSSYRMRRSCIEEAPVNGKAQRVKESVDLWKITPAGTDRVPDSQVDALIEKALPESLKDVYFTDGDRAMSFIEAAASQGVKRRRVTNAIESLLGLKILDNTVSHLNAVAKRFSQEIDDNDYQAELEAENDKIISYTEDLEENQELFEEAVAEVAQINKELVVKEKQIEELLTLGDRETLVRQQQELKANIASTERIVTGTFRSFVEVVSSESLSKALLSKEIEQAKDFLNKMNRVKQLPQVNIPILEELLDRNSCFCGADLREESKDGSNRRKEIQATIEASLESDRIQTTATSLFYRIRSESTKGAKEKWLELYSDRYSTAQNAQRTLSSLQQEAEALDTKINNINDAELQKLREQRENLSRSLNAAQSKQAKSSSNIEYYQERLSDSEKVLERIRKKLGKTNSSTLNWDITLLARDTFSKVIEVLRLEELEKVSVEMNRIFLAMIGADSHNPDFQLIQGAELTNEFDIVVYGPNKHILNPDQDLNGASRRAITLAFILALTKVSQVEAPNIIDTPLGMMSGYVKQSVLLRTIQEGSQVVLFLTHDEIRGVEEILDKFAGDVFTLTNPSHYPKMIKNKPENMEEGVIRCECNHRTHCNVCERKNAEVA